MQGWRGEKEEEEEEGKKSELAENNTEQTRKLEKKQCHRAAATTTTANKRAMQIYFKTIYFVLSEYLHWFRFRAIRMWMSTRFMTIYVVRFCDRYFALLSRSFLSSISHVHTHTHSRTNVCFSEYFCWVLELSFFFCFWHSHDSLAWNWHKTWRHELCDFILPSSLSLSLRVPLKLKLLFLL